MSATPTVSVLVTLYNRAEYIEDSINSILQSGFDDYELIVVDDHSTDRSLEVANRLAASDDRVRVITNDRNLGDYGNRNRAADLARGEYLKYVDSDDLIYPHTLEVMVSSMRKHPQAGAGLAHSLPEDEMPYPWLLSSEEAYRRHFLGRGCLSCGPTGAIIRRDVFEALGGFEEAWGLLTDMDMWFRLAARYPVVLLPPGLVWWRRHPGQEFVKPEAAESYLRRAHELDSSALGKTCPLPEHQRQRALDRRKVQYARQLGSLAIRQLAPTRALRLFFDSKLTFTDLLRAASPNQRTRL